MSSFASKTLSVFDRIHLRRSGTHEGGSKVTSKTKRNIGIVVAVLVVILLALPFFINVNSFRPKIESELSNALGRKAEVGELSLSVLRGSVSAANISIADDPAFSKSPFLTAKSLKIGVELMPLIFSKQLNITGITLDEPSISLLSAPNGTWNFSSLGVSTSKPGPTSSGAPPSNFSVAKLDVTDGKVLVGKINSRANSLIIGNVNVGVENFSVASQFPFTLTADLPGSGKLKLEGKAGPIAPAGTPLQASLKIQKLDLALLGADPSLGLGGIGNLDGTLDSDGRAAKLGGTLSLDKLKLSPKGSPAGRAVQVKFATDYDLKKHGGMISQGEASAGKAVARLTGTYQTAGETTVVNMNLNGPGLPVEDVESLLPALGVTLPSGSKLQGGTLSATLGIKGPTDKLVIEGPVKLQNSSLAGFDLGTKLSALSALRGKATPSRDTTIQNASTNARLAPEGTRLDAINVTVPSLGVLTGAGTVSASGALNFRMVAELGGGAGGGVPERLGRREARSGGGIPFAIEGTTADPKFVPEVGAIATGAAKQAISQRLNPKAESTTRGLGGLLRKKP
jgi:AsmA protein